jgi:CheY-like chemotaxis protein
MPGIRGDSAVKAIRTQRPNIKAIMMTGYADHELMDAPESILNKPFELPELGRRLRLVLDAAAGTAHHLDPAA